jgi:hypothetical protein
MFLSGGYNPLSYAEVGFTENPVAEVKVVINGTTTDTNLADYHAQIKWDPNSGWTPADLALNAAHTSVLIKGSHIYQQPGNYPIEVYVTGLDGTSATGQTGIAVVQPMPSGIPGTPPPQSTKSIPPSDVSFILAGGTTIVSSAGVGFTNKGVASFEGFVNGKLDMNSSDFHAQINWGDSNKWTSGTIVPLPGSSNSLQVLGSHAYTQPGTFPIVVYVTGPDGTSVSNRMDSAVVQLLGQVSTGGGTVTLPGGVKVIVAPGAIPQEAGVDWNRWYLKWMDVVGVNVFQPLDAYFASQPGSVPNNEYTATVNYMVYPDGTVVVTGGTAEGTASNGSPLPGNGQQWGISARNYMLALNAGYDGHAVSLMPSWPAGSKLTSLSRSFTFSRNWPGTTPGVFYAGPPQE